MSKDILTLAREAGIEPVIDPIEGVFFDCYQEELERFAELVRADERNSWPSEMEAMERQVNILTDALAEARADMKEKCAKMCDQLAIEDGLHQAKYCANAIRGRMDE